MSEVAEPRPGTPAVLRVGFVPGVTLTKWRRIWGERFPRVRLELTDVTEAAQRLVLVDDLVDVCFVRLPIDKTGLHVIPLYEEVGVVVVKKDHPASLFDELTLADLEDEAVIEADHPDAIDLVAGGAGVLFVPQSIAREHSRRDLVYRPVTDAPLTTVGLSWRTDDDLELIEDFIGVVRGRTANSSRNRSRSVANNTEQKSPRRPTPAARGQRTNVRRSRPKGR